MARKVSRGAIFNQNVAMKTPHTTFDLAHSNKFSCRAGYLYPVFCKRVVPGDYFKFDNDVFLRTLPLVTPAFVDFDVDIRYFYIPNRLVWKDFNDFIVNPDQDSLIPPVVSFNSQQCVNGDLFDFLGCPASTNVGTVRRPISAYRFRAYNLIWNTWYRDQNLQDEVVVNDENDGSVPDAQSDYQLLRCAWKRDYFTSCLPDAQFGNAVKSGLDLSVVPNGKAGLIRTENGDVMTYGTVNANFSMRSGSVITGDNPTVGPNGVEGNFYRSSGSSGDGVNPDRGLPAIYDPNGTLKAMMSVSELREMTAMQRFRERLIVGGTRIKEYIKSMFGVDIPDARAQYPEFLGGGSVAITIGEVPQTSSSDTTSPQGNLAGRGVTANRISVPMYFVPEYGFIMGVMVVRPKADYFQGFDRELTQMDYYDYYNPMFEHIGEQEVLKSEIYAVDESDDGLFGYQSRNADYKFFNNEVHGQFRNMSGVSLGSWHLARNFGSVPSLNSSFIQCNPDVDRIFAVDTSKLDYLVVQLRNHVVASRPMSEFSTPSLIG